MAVAFFISYGLPVFAALVPCGGPGQADCTVCHLFLLTKDVLYYAMALTLLVSSAIFIFCGFNMIANRGNVKTSVKTKKLMWATTIGLVIIFSGWVVVNTYFISAGAAEWNGYSLSQDWWKISTKCDKPKAGEQTCGDGVVQEENKETCDPKETIDDCQSRTGFSKEGCDKMISGCNPDKCFSQYCGDGKIQADEECDPGISVKMCVQSGKTMAVCTKMSEQCQENCTLDEDIVKEEDDDDPYVEGRCLDHASGAHSPDCPELHTGLDGYKLIKKDFKVNKGDYHDSALSPIEAKGPNGEKICMCFDTCGYPEKFKYVLTDADERLFDVYATPAGEALYKQMGELALMDDTKPVIYLYPEKKIDVAVTINPKGRMTASIPDYGNGWNVSVEPGGLIDGKYGYLFYETEIKASELNLPYKGFLVPYGELEGFFDTILPRVGLRGQEITDFKEWWLDGRLEPANYYLVQLLDEQTIEEIEPMTIDPKPDTVIRIRFVFTPTDKEAETIEPLIETPERRGFTAVEWGGLVEKK